MDDPNGKSKGGRARAKLLSPERKMEISKMGVEAKKYLASLPRVSHKGDHRGVIKIADITLACCVLEDGRRLISENAINSTLGTSGGKTYRLRDSSSAESDTGPMPLFLASKALNPFIHAVFGETDLTPIEYNDGGKIGKGFEASIIPKACEVWLQAAENKALQPSQYSRAKKAEILVRGLARVGIVALIDEATGYQKDRAKDELAKILEAFVAKELQPYLKTFPTEYYEQLFRLYGYTFPPENKRPQWRPVFFGKITNEVVYNRLAPAVLPELKKAASKAEKKAKLFQWLTSDIGHPKLREHLSSIVSIMKLSKTPQDFRKNVDIVYPRFNETIPIDFSYPDDDPNA